MALLCMSHRWILSYLAFFCIWLVFGTRSNISMSLPCMVKPKAFNVSTHNTSAENITNIGVCGTIVAGALESVKVRLQKGGKYMEHYEFDWKKETESLVLSAIYYGNLLTTIPGGYLADRFGGKRIVTVTMAVIGLLNILTPLVTRFSVEALICIRIVIGAASGPVLPATISLWGKWAPKNERTRLQVFTLMGIPIGTCATFFVSGFLCNSGIDNGWPMIFYYSGATVLLWLIPWVFLTADSPSQHRKISHIERTYIESHTDIKQRVKMDCVSFKAMITSKAVWAPVIAHFCANWVYLTLTTGLPLYIQEVFSVDITKNGIWSSIPFVCQAFIALISSYVCDKIQASRKLTTKMARKVFHSVGSLGTALGLAAIGLMTCDDGQIVVVFLCISLGFRGIQMSGLAANFVDVAPRFAGMIFSISSTLAILPGIVSPLITGFITKNETQQEWRNVFFISCSISLFGGAIFAIFAEGEIQQWAKCSTTLKKVKTVTVVNSLTINVSENTNIHSDSGVQKVNFQIDHI